MNCKEDLGTLDNMCAIIHKTTTILCCTMCIWEIPLPWEPEKDHYVTKWFINQCCLVLLTGTWGRINLKSLMQLINEILLLYFHHKLQVQLTQVKWITLEQIQYPLNCSKVPTKLYVSQLNPLPASVFLWCPNNPKKFTTLELYCIFNVANYRRKIQGYWSNHDLYPMICYQTWKYQVETSLFHECTF